MEEKLHIQGMESQAPKTILKILSGRKTAIWASTECWPNFVTEDNILQRLLLNLKVCVE
jgi:ribosomal protein RSM22 (predicted rRNA methylase)